jgi:hypothetical protein
VLDILALFGEKWGAAHNVRVTNARLDPTPPLPVHYRREVGRGSIIAGVSAFFLMFGALNVRRQMLMWR